MIIAKLPGNEQARLNDLLSYDISDTPPEADFDALVELASQICKCPIALITLLDKDRLCFKAKTGLAIESISRDVAFCSHTILSDTILVIGDTLKDERFSDNPLVTGTSNVRFYAGAPITSPTGHKMGTICLMDHHPRTLTKEDERALLVLAGQVTRLLEVRRQSAVIRQLAEEVVQLKQKAIKQVMEDNEELKKEIATNLHEDFAQEIALSMMYLNSAEAQSRQRVSLIRKARVQLGSTLGKIRDLSTIITPLTINWLGPEDTISEFIEKRSVTLPFIIQVIKDTNTPPIEPRLTIAAIRILEEWLKILALKEHIDSVCITISVSDHVELQIEDRGSANGFEIRKLELMESTIYDRVNAYGGSISLLSSEHFTVIVSLPVVLEQVGTDGQ